MRFIDFNFAAKNLNAAGGIATFSGADLPRKPRGLGLIGFIYVLAGASNDISQHSRHRIRAGSRLICDFDPRTYLRALFESQSLARNATIGANATGFTVMFNDFSKWNPDEADTCQFPVAAAGAEDDISPVIEFVTAALTTPTVQIGAIYTDQPAQTYSRFIGFDSNTGPSVTNGKIPVPTRGLLRALLLPNPVSNAPTRYRVLASRQEMAIGTPSSILAAIRQDQPASITLPLVIPFANGLPAPEGTVQVEVDTGSTTLVGLDTAFWEIVPQGT